MSAAQAFSPAQAARTPLRRCVILDRRGRRIVMPRYTPDDAIEQVTRAVAGRQASAEQKRAAWERLRDHDGYRLVWVAGSA
ncbi:MAG TPA: hypothetical protein VNU71_15195 [Burkholderiaceae bacterium]|nr:hypothetical protein [Burkholderiaceae bacterium]